MAPSISTRALFYNKDLFDRYGVPYPTNAMTWDDVLALAKRFPTKGEGEGRIYGFGSGVMGTRMEEKGQWMLTQKVDQPQQ